MVQTVLMTGVAGFIGSHAAAALLARGDRVVGLDNLNAYYDPALKRANLQFLRDLCPTAESFYFVEGDVRDRDLVERLLADYDITSIVHLAAMGGVRASTTAPHLYYEVNVGGTLTLLEAAARRTAGVRGSVAPTFVLASTSAVYGNTGRPPFQETDPADRPRSAYAGSKRAAELAGYTHHHLHGLNFTALRFFTVYGPRSRPDMMACQVMDSIAYGKEVPLFDGGQLRRDWAYVEDLAGGIVAAVDRPLGYEVINLGSGEPVVLADFVRQIERCAGRRANLVPAPMPDTDMPATCASIDKARRLLGYDPKTSVEEGVSRLWRWYEETVLRRQTQGEGG